ncbi:hypothetical protein JTE90_003884 [Oedothorax gibbosus]|uniref:Uncharacterized protein n=1 Tax=Oedothorax gibbosus TaxID=931172 RepID=A0AAV6UGV0_9ARAC|nr:hypothetical protein JTE90_003884 [Oedothorax gibbosus]
MSSALNCCSYGIYVKSHRQRERSSTTFQPQSCRMKAHEAEKWKKYQAKADLILKTIERRQQLWEMMVVIENKANDPNRFNNRGGNLLKEEKQRKKVRKDPPALEEEIFRDIDYLKEKDGLDFFYRREDFKTYVANQWSEMFPQKDNKKPLKPKSVLTTIQHHQNPPSRKKTQRQKSSRPICCRPTTTRLVKLRPKSC